MAEYLINTSSFLGYQCCGASVYADGSGYVTLSDKQVSDLVELIKKNGGESDPEILDLKDNLPEIYNILDKAYHDTAYKTEYRHWLLEGDMDDVYYRDDNFMERLEEDGLFLFEFDEEEYREKYDLGEDDEITENDIEDEKSDAFDEWLQEYKDSLSDDEKVVFYEKYYGPDLVDLEYDEVEYKVEIPEEIIRLTRQ